MSKFLCENTECPKFGIEDEYTSNTYRTVNGELQSNNAPCPSCKSIRREINPNMDIPLSEKNISIGEYTSASPKAQKEILQKRSHEHYKKEIKPLKDFRLQTAVKDFNEASKK